jgi:hypothetical protein
MCYVPRIAAGVAEVYGAHHLQGEYEVLGGAGARILEAASAESMVDAIEQCNPAVVHSTV